VTPTASLPMYNLLLQLFRERARRCPSDLQLAEFEAQQLRIPPRPGDRQLIVGQYVGALLRLGPARGDHHRDLGDAELPGGEDPGVARNQTAVLANQRRRRPAPLLDARRDRRDLRISVGPCIFRVRDQPIDRPPLDLVGRPRPLIFTADSRAGARAPRRGKCWRFYAPVDPLQAALRLAPLIIPVV
jgi:hypothetical protein